MKLFPKNLTPDSLQSFQEKRYKRNILYVRSFLYEFMIQDDFIENKNRGIELSFLQSKFNISSKEVISILEILLEELKNLGWETKFALNNTYVFIYPPDDIPKMLKYTYEEF